MYPIDIGWNSNQTLIQTEKANKVILKSSGADPSPSIPAMRKPRVAGAPASRG
jgi:hypothetical protein